MNMNGLKEHIAVLERENDDLRERVAFLESELGSDIEAPLSFGLTPREACLCGVLLKNRLVSNQMAMASLYHLYADGELPDAKIIDVFICKMRKKLKAFDVQIETVWGQGYLMPNPSKEIVRSMMQD